MPVVIKAFACQFRCGRIGTKSKSIEKHERNCFHNPERRACQTCRNNEYVPYEDDTGAGGYFECKADILPVGSKMVFECIAWEAKMKGPQ